MINFKPTYISLFSSSGVGCYGFKLEGFECIATNEIISRRLKIQKLNEKCKFDTGYILEDIKLKQTKELIYSEIKRWKKLGNDRVDVVIATPPCQGMSIANHKKSSNEIERNSLIVESVEIIAGIRPRIFVFENVAAFWKTGCVDKNDEVLSIGNMILSKLNDNYEIQHKIINFKNYGSNSSRTRTLVIGVDKKLTDKIKIETLFPDETCEKTLFEVIGDMKHLEWGEYDANDFFHSFRTYSKHMLPWIENLKEGESAFDNTSDELKPHKVIDGKIVINKAKNGDKYKRQRFNKVAPCIHTRNDQLASQNTIHPVDNRVFSIRELMRLMTIPDSFKWIDHELDYLNSLSIEEKQKISKKEEMNIRQSIGEAVPTEIFHQIAKKIKQNLIAYYKKGIDASKVIAQNELHKTENMRKFLLENKDNLSLTELSNIVENANANRFTNSAFYTNNFIVEKIMDYLPDFNKEEVTIVEPSVGFGNFLTFIFKKYSNIKHLKVTVVDIDSNILELLKIVYSQKNIPNNVTINFVCADYMDYEHEKVDLIIGNPPFTKISGEYRQKLLENNYNLDSTNLAEFFLEKAINNAEYVSMIMPKNILNTPEFTDSREFLSNHNIESIIDFGEKGFKGVLVETINLVIETGSKSEDTLVVSTTLKTEIMQKSSYIFDNKLPYWIIYRNGFFDKVFKGMKLGIFDVFRDRQITNNNTVSINDENKIQVVKSRNILDSGKIVKIDGYDSYIDKDILSSFAVNRFLNDNSVYLTPNMTYKPRLVKKNGSFVVNGSVAILILKDKNLEFSQEQLDFIASEEFREFYKIARNYQTRSLNIDKSSCYWFGIKL